MFPPSITSYRRQLSCTGQESLRRPELHEVPWGITARYGGTCMSSISLALNGAASSSFTKYWLDSQGSAHSLECSKTWGIYSVEK